MKLAVSSLLVLSPLASALGGPDVAIVASEFPISVVNDPRNKLVATGLFNSVTIIDARITTPTLSELMAFDAVLAWSNHDFHDSLALGNTMADYVDAGGGVVVAMFLNGVQTTAVTLQGRWITGGYTLILPYGLAIGQATLGTIHAPGHPLVAGVASFDGGPSSYRPAYVPLPAASLLVASWSDGRVLAAVHGTYPARVDLGFYPLSSDVNPSNWIASTDGDLLLANALLYAAAAGGDPGLVYCSGDGTGTPCPCGNAGISGNGCASSVSPIGAHLESSGLASLSGDTVVLRGSSMPNSSALYFQGTTQTAGGMGSPFGDGLRCASGTIIRLHSALNVAGASSFPPAGSVSLSGNGALTGAGIRTYQVWYRNAAPYCTPSTYNFTNGLWIDWRL